VVQFQWFLNCRKGLNCLKGIGSTEAAMQDAGKYGVSVGKLCRI